MVDAALAHPALFARQVRAGRVQGDLIELLEGVEPGERVVVDGQFALVDGAVVFVDGPTAGGGASEPAWND